MLNPKVICVLPIVFWQQTRTPHMVSLANELAEMGVAVTYVSNVELKRDRVNQGWEVPQSVSVRFLTAPDKQAVESILLALPVDAVHVCQGIRGHSLVGRAQRCMRDHGFSYWVVMERVDDTGYRGFFKRLIYRYLFNRSKQSIKGILAIGKGTDQWVISRGMPRARVFPFAYFLREFTAESSVPNIDETKNRPVRFIFVGQMIERKRLSFLIDTLASMVLSNFELWVLGRGPLEKDLKKMAESALGDRLRWFGRRPMSEISTLMLQADCLILPSRHDGWGAVVSEALMVGTPVICSDACGSAEVVNASNVGSVFVKDAAESLRHCIEQRIASGKVTAKQRDRIAQWARCLGARAGAAYLSHIIEHCVNKDKRPTPPWLKNEDSA